MGATQVRIPDEAVQRPVRERPWLPQILAFVHPDHTHRRFFDFLHVLGSKPRHGLMILGSVLEISEEDMQRNLMDAQVCR